MINIVSAITIADLTFIYALPTMGLWLTNRVLKRYDLTLEGSFCLAGALSAFVSLAGYPFCSIAVGVCAGLIVGTCTFLLHIWGAIELLMCGIIVNTALFSLSLLLVGPHLSIMQSTSIFSHITALIGKAGPTLLLFIVVTVFIYSIKWLLNTEFGLVWRAVGDNKNLLMEFGKSVKLYTFFTLALSNMLSALSGALFVHYVGFFSIWSNVGLTVIGLTALLAAQLIKSGFGIQLLLGSLCYQLIIAVTLHINIAPQWHKIIAALITLVLMISARRHNHD